MAVPALARMNHRVRTAAFGYAFVLLAVHLWPAQPGAVLWTLLALQFLAVPQLLLWRVRRSAEPKRTELENVFIDAAALGAWAAYLGFPTWITFAFAAGSFLGAAVNRGVRGVAIAAACGAAGAGACVALFGFRYAPETSVWVNALSAAA